MGWRLIYRSLGAVIRLGRDVPADELASTRCYEHGFGSVGYVELVRLG